MDSLYSALLGAGVPSIACIILCWLVKRQLNDDAAARKRLEEKVTTLETEKFRKLERQVETHLAADKSGEILTQLASLTAELRRNNDKTDRTLELAAAHESRLAAHDLYLKNLDDFGREHIRNYHRGRR